MATIRMRRDGAGTDRGRTAWPSLAVALAAPWLRASGTGVQHRSPPTMPVLLSGMALCATVLTASVGAVTYTVTDLGTLGGTSSIAHAINASGDVVGTSERSGSNRAFLFKDGVMKDLGTLDGAGDSEAHGINDQGDIVGTAHGIDPPGGGNFPFLYRAGTMTQLDVCRATFPPPFPPHFEAVARHINGHGQIIGSSGGSGFAGCAGFLFSDGMEDTLPCERPDTPGSYLRGVPAGINSTGQVVGNCFGPAVYEGGVWTRLGIPEDATASDINDDGEVVGEIVGTDDLGHAFLYSKGTLIDLEAFADPAIQESHATAINGRGEVVGRAILQVDGSDYAFIYDPQEGMRNLNDLVSSDSGLVLESATDINDAGQIVGRGEIGDGEETHAFLASPCEGVRVDCAQSCQPGSSECQLCEPSFSESVHVVSRSSLMIRYDVGARHCSPVRLRVSLDGVPVLTTGLLGWPGATGVHASLPLGTGLLDLGTVEAGTHVVDLRAEGEVGGCNQGRLGTWGGCLTVKTECPNVSIDCTSPGQLCEPRFSTSVTMASPSRLTMSYRAGDRHCSPVRLRVAIDGTPVLTTGLLGWPGATGESASLPLSTGSLDLGAVGAGTHVLSLQAEGEVGGCNAGRLGSWGGCLRLPTGAAPASTTTTTVVVTTTSTVVATTTSTTTTASVPRITTTTTVPCTDPRCTLGAVLVAPACAGQTLPASVRNALDRALGLVDQAGAASGKKAERVLRKAKAAFKTAGRAAGKAAKGKQPKLPAGCATELREAVDGVRAGLGT